MCSPQTFSHYPAWPTPIELPLVEGEDHPCNYLPDRVARMRAFAARSIAPELYHQFMDAGFRRSGLIVYQPACPRCRACVPLRVLVESFHPSRSQRRCWRQNQDLRVEVSDTRATIEEYELYSRYLKGWHKGPDDSRDGFERFLCDTPVNSIKFMYRDMSNCLLAVGICDVCPQSLSSVYFYFDPSHARRGLGTYGALSEIEYARRLGIPAYYLGYWVEGCSSMRYKSDFRPSEGLGTDGRWRRIERTAAL
jgi:leucyl-tRNA---protein transferase